MVEVNTSLTLLVVLMFYKLTTHGSAVDIKKKNGTAALSLTSAPNRCFNFHWPQVTVYFIYCLLLEISVR